MRCLSMKSIARVLFIIFPFCVVPFFTYPIFGEELSVEQKEIWQMEEKRWDTWKKERAESLKVFYHKDAIIWGSNLTWPSDRAITSAGEYYDARVRYDNPIETYHAFSKSLPPRLHIALLQNSQNV